MHWSLSLVTCLPHLCICILTLAFLHRSDWRSSSSLSRVSWGLSSIYFTLSVFDIPYLIWGSDHSDFSSAHYLWCLSRLMKRPYRYMSLRSLTRWSSVLPTVQTRQFFFSSPLWFEPGISSTKAHHSANCASQTAVLMWGIIFVYMLKLIDVFPSQKKKKSFGLRSRDPRLER